jgi:hypothetical protein
MKAVFGSTRGEARTAIRVIYAEGSLGAVLAHPVRTHDAEVRS